MTLVKLSKFSVASNFKSLSVDWVSHAWSFFNVAPFYIWNGVQYLVLTILFFSEIYFGHDSLLNWIRLLSVAY